jgi:hypothetical protein
VKWTLLATQYADFSYSALLRMPRTAKRNGVPLPSLRLVRVAAIPSDERPDCLIESASRSLHTTFLDHARNVANEIRAGMTP